jgi:formate dehydrogenase subunit delta
MSPEKMIHMANQIAAFFHTVPEGEGAKGVAEHINNFWEPRMRAQLFAMTDKGDTEKLDPLLVKALPLIRRPRTEAA